MGTSAKITDLMTRLCKVMLGEDKPDSVSLSLRYLASNVNITTEKDEFQVAEEIKRKLTRRKGTIQNLSGSQAALKFQECNARLGNDQYFPGKWALLYLLNKLAPQDPSSTKEIAFHVGIQALPVKSTPIPREPSTAFAPFVPAAPTGGTAPRGTDSSEISESLLLHDVIFALQGIDGQYIKYDSKVDGFCVIPSANVSHSVRQLVRRVCEVGWMYKKVCSYINSVIEAPVMGLVEQSFCGALQQELTDYYRLVAVLESQVNEGSNGAKSEFGQFSLRRMLLWILDPLERIKLMAIVTEATRGLKGGSLASAVGAHLQHGDPAVQTFVRRIMEQVCSPIFGMIRDWVTSGELRDPHGEFFVASDESKPPEALWRDKYTLRTSMLPSFISPELGAKILMIGKSINFCRLLCQEPHWASHISISFQQVFQVGNSQHGNLETVVNEAAQDTNARVMRLLLDKFKFPLHCLAFKKYLLLGAGDFIQVLLDQLSSTLNNEADTLARHNLKGALETAIRSSNAQFEDPEILDRLDVRLQTASPGERGWDIFSLDFKTNSPLNVIFTEECINKYLRVFNFMWRLKRLEHTLNGTWNRHMSMARRMNDSLVQALRRSHIVRAEMQHFVQTLHNYMMFEVLECAWKDLVDDIAKAKSLEDLILAHENYLKQIVDTGLGGSESTSLLAHLSPIFRSIIRFGHEQEVFYENTFKELDQQTEKKLQEGAALTKGSSGLMAAVPSLDQFMAQLATSEATFKKEVLRFFEALREFGSPTSQTVSQALIHNLGFLSFRLDFNEFYATARKV